MEWLHGAGVAAYDLLGNPADYKSTWSDTTVPLHGFVTALTLRGRVVGPAWYGGLKPVLKRVYGSIPVPVRRAFLAPGGGRNHLQGSAPNTSLPPATP
jgi:hypothetical protein